MRRLLLAVALAAVGVGMRVGTAPPQPRLLRVSPESPKSAADRGRLVYLRYGCALCHGADGKGGFANANAETEGKVPAVIYVAEGYTRAEVRTLLMNGTPTIGKADQNGPTPPYRMPGWRGQMTDQELGDLVEYLFSLYSGSADEKW